YDRRPVKPVRTNPLRRMRMIPPSEAPPRREVEPVRPQPPLTGDPEKAARQEILGPVISAPAPTGLGFEGVGVGIPGFVTTRDPPDVNGQVVATQFVQWNNASFAVFDKPSGALLYGPAAGNTLFQPLGGVC